MRKNIFCLVGESGSGKTTYINQIMKDKRFIDKVNLKLLVTGTTRKMRPGEVDGVDYHFMTEEEFLKIPSSELIGSRSYYTLNNGTIYFFTKEEYVQTHTNLLCVTSPYQYESYRNWIAKENIRGNDYRLYMIYIHTDLKTRIIRCINRAKEDIDVFEVCRRAIQEKSEFEDAGKRLPELIDPMMSTYLCYIINGVESSIEENWEAIKRFILKFSK